MRRTHVSVFDVTKTSPKKREKMERLYLEWSRKPFHVRQGDRTMWGNRVADLCSMAIVLSTGLFGFMLIEWVGWVLGLILTFIFGVTIHQLVLLLGSIVITRRDLMEEDFGKRRKAEREHR